MSHVHEFDYSEHEPDWELMTPDSAHTTNCAACGCLIPKRESVMADKGPLCAECAEECHRLEDGKIR